MSEGFDKYNLRNGDGMFEEEKYMIYSARNDVGMSILGTLTEFFPKSPYHLFDNRTGQLMGPGSYDPHFWDSYDREVREREASEKKLHEERVAKGEHLRVVSPESTVEGEVEAA